MTRPAFCVVDWRIDDDDACRQAADVAEHAVASGMPQVVTGPGYMILSSHSISFFPENGGGQIIVIGKAYGAFTPLASQSSILISSRIADPDAAAHRLSNAIYGAYVAVIPTADGATVFADPSGALPFDMVAGNGVAIATDNLTSSFCRALGFKPRIEWASLVATLVSPATAVHLSHLADVQPAAPGHLYKMAEVERGVLIWSPTDIARQASDDGKALRQAVDRSTAAMGGSACALQLSGGLDSSIVLSSLRAANHRAVAITFATAAAGGDERDYAALMAKHCGSPLNICEAGRLPTYEALFRDAPGAHPFIYGLDDAFEDAVAAAALSAGCNQILTGQGGDAVFFQPPTPLVAVDRARALGFGPAALRPLLDDARRMRSSIWHHLLPAIADRFRAASVPNEHLAVQLLTSKGQALIGAGLKRHPWLNDVGDLPPGKVMHLTMLANSQIFHARRPGNRGMVVQHPLLTQPVLEAALSIPTYELACGTNDRGLVRGLFADRLPPDIIARRTKGEAASHYSRAALANLPFLREVLLDGVMVREGLVDRDAMNNLLTREQLFFSLDYRALVMHATCEAWARYWDAA